MRGLFRNNFYATLLGAEAFTGIALLVGVFVVAMDNAIPSLIIGYMLLVMIGFSLNSIASIRKESATKWGKYKLTVPVRKRDIVISFFASQLLWLAVGIVFAGVGIALSIALHGNPFDRNTDIFMLFVLGIGISLFMGAIFFPLYFLGGEERNEVILVVSLLGGIGVIMGLTTLINIMYPGNMTTWQTVMSGIFMMACGAASFTVSVPLSVGVFQRKEY
ncbi:MAG: ABC-2 transporter permease [Lachnospiraceae bacterium]|nr:ABC-2 transporter permease [Lachnospiraceae bacterium]